MRPVSSDSTTEELGALDDGKFMG